MSKGHYTKSELKEYEKIEKTVTGTYQKIEDGGVET